MKSKVGLPCTSLVGVGVRGAGVPVQMLHVLEVDAHSFLAVGPTRVEADRNVNLGLAVHDAVHAHATAARGYL